MEAALMIRIISGALDLEMMRDHQPAPAPA
jgi:hypothetical protein